MASVTLQEFLTPQRTLVIKNKNGKKIRCYKLARYSLAIHSIFHNEFATDTQPDGSQNFVTRLTNNDPIVCLKGLYILIDDKSDFPTFEEFTRLLDVYSAPIFEVQLLLTQVFKDSLPTNNKKKVIIPAVLLTLLALIGAAFMII